MFEKIFIFIVFLAPLIFFHELGHFFFARLFGVRVEVFSIGFGPKIFKYLHKGTEYAISIIPLGGYVKMFGDDPFSEVPLSEEEKKVAFNHKGKFARFWIVFGGPLANFILAYFLYVGLLAGGEKVPESKLGFVPETSLLYQKGLKTGDTLVRVNDEKISSFDDLNIKGSEIEVVTVNRDGELLEIPIDMKLEPFINEFMGILSPVRKPYLLNPKGERFFLSLKQGALEENYSLEETFSKFNKKAFVYKFIDNEGNLKIDSSSELELNSLGSETLKDLIQRLNFYPVDLCVRNVVMASPADKAGIRKADIIVAVNDKYLSSFEDLRNLLQNVSEGESVTVKVISGGQYATKSLVPEIKEIDGKKLKIIGIESAVEYVQPKLVTVKAESFSVAILGALDRTWDGIVKTFGGYKKLITREVSLNNIGGPLAIGKVASDSFNISLSMFFRLMAIISINLAIINLFPIPVLDGGHIMFLFFETINRGPLSRRKLEIAQRFGMSVLFFLIFVALFNDISRLF